MIKILKWVGFLESISGWELVGPDMGPNYPKQEIPNTLSTSQTSVIASENGTIYTWDDYQQLYIDYLKSGGSPLQGFTKYNIDIVIDFLSENT